MLDFIIKSAAKSKFRKMQITLFSTVCPVTKQAKMLSHNFCIFCFLFF